MPDSALWTLYQRSVTIIGYAHACSDKSRHLPRVTRAFDQDDAAELL
jgi:hypothetical protein